jgi:hypothetical protein
MKYLPTDLESIQKDLTDFSAMDEDGDAEGINDTGYKISVIKSIFNTLENNHKSAFIVLLKYQFLLSSGKVSKNNTKVTPFVQRQLKILKENEKKKDLSLFEEYKKMYPENISEILCKIYSTPEEEKIKLFEYYKDELKKYKFSDLVIDNLIKEEIQTPGFIGSYIEYKDEELPYVIPKGWFDKKYKLLYTKRRNRWYKKKVLQNLSGI